MTQAEKRQVLDVLIYALAHAKCAVDIAEQDNDKAAAEIYRKDLKAVQAAYETMCREVGVDG